MAILQFLAGTNFLNKTLTFQPGTIYLDTSTGEMWFDDPEEQITDHSKIIDLDTLIYEIEETVEFGGSGENPPDDEETTNETAKLGYAILGKMKLGQP